jgi:hypothetical protein
MDDEGVPLEDREKAFAVVIGYLDMSDTARLAISNKEMFAFSQSYMHEYLTGALRVAAALTRVLVFGCHNLHSATYEALVRNHSGVEILDPETKT